MKKIVYILLIIVASILALYFYMEYDRAPQTAEDRRSDFVLSVPEFVLEFSEDALAADAKYKNKTLELTGVVADININGNNVDIQLETDDDMVSINVQLAATNKQDESLMLGKEIALKAIYVGVLTDLGIDIELNQATILNRIK